MIWYVVAYFVLSLLLCAEYDNEIKIKNEDCKNAVRFVLIFFAPPMAVLFLVGIVLSILFFAMFAMFVYVLSACKGVFFLAKLALLRRP